MLKTMKMEILLSESTICRLCGEENENGVNLFGLEDSIDDLASTINKYLPITVERDDKVPSMLCPGCTIQLEATKSFFDLIIEGQNKIRNLLIEQQESLRLQFDEKEKLEKALKIVNSNATVQAFELANDEAGENFLIQIFSEGPLFTQDQEISLAENVEKPKKKRGRPQKEEAEILEEIVQEEAKADLEGKRKIKKPSRYVELLEGKELEDVLKKEGIFDDDNLMSDMESKAVECKSRRKFENVIGLMEDENGKNLGQLITVKNKCKIVKNVSKEINDKKLHKCNICGLGFKQNSQLSMHLEFHKTFYYYCKSLDCSVKFETKVALDEHQKETGHSGFTFSKENIEVESSNSNKTLIKLLAPNPNEELELQTSKVNEGESKVVLKLETSEELVEQSKEKTQNATTCKKCSTSENHACTHKNKTYQCEECPRVFHHPSSLIYHRDADHNSGIKFVCLKCKKPFKHKQLLLKHQHVHSNERPHSCNQCNATFKTRANLLNHMLIHTGEKKYTCPECGNSFSHKTSLTLHLRMHKGLKPFKCDVCSKWFSQKGNLQEHKRTHTGEKPYICSYCGRKFTTSSQCDLHIKRHTGEKPWKCEYCSKTFLHKETWACHTRRHRNETPFQCKQCLRSFSEQWSLRKHQRLHTGERPHKCDVCQKSFADSSNLRKHRKIHRDVPPKKGDTKNTQPVSLQLFYDVDGKEDTLVQIVDSVDNEQILLEVPGISTNDDISVDLQIQHLIDNDGKPVILATDSGEKIKVVSTIINNEPSLQGLMNDGTLIPLNLSSDGKSIVFGKDEEEKEPTAKTNPQTAKPIGKKKVDILSHNVFKSKSKQDVFDVNKLEYVDDADVENVCLIMPFDDDDDNGNGESEFIY